MRNILCFGDSNTWGFDIEAWLKAGSAYPTRYAPEIRWPGVLAAALGSGWTVIEEGLNGRTTVFDDPVEGRHKNGSRYLAACLESHAPLDTVVVMLGTNDLKARFSAPAADIAAGAVSLARMVLESGTGPGGKAPGVLLVAPFPLGEGMGTSPFGEMFGFEAGLEKSRRLGERFAEAAAGLGVPLLDSGRIVTAHPLDSLHLSAAAHRDLGLAVAKALGA